MAAKKDTIRIAAAADLHLSRTSHGVLASLFGEVNERADVLVLCGDLTDHGLPEEAHIVAKELRTIARVPMVGVLGNHDYESGQQADIQKILADAGIQILNGESCEVLGIGFAGVKGFAGGFGARALQPWGEEAIKSFVHEAVEETLKLETALVRLKATHRVALLHYSPILATVKGEPPEIFPFLGSSRLEEPLNRYGVAMAFHGHAHHGSPEGRTSADIPVYNVSLRLLQESYPGAPPFRVAEIRRPSQPPA
jgi:Icc-related predicted phosphoesterase